MPRPRSRFSPELVDPQLERRELMSRLAGMTAAAVGESQAGGRNLFHQNGIDGLVLHRTFVNRLNDRLNTSKDQTTRVTQAFQAFATSFKGLPVAPAPGGSGPTLDEPGRNAQTGGGDRPDPARGAVLSADAIGANEHQELAPGSGRAGPLRRRPDRHDGRDPGTASPRGRLRAVRRPRAIRRRRSTTPSIRSSTPSPRPASTPSCSISRATFT